jgi:hypothetical protein
MVISAARDVTAPGGAIIAKVALFPTAITGFLIN